MENFTPISALFGGALIGLGAVLLLACNGRIAGISGIMNGLFETSPHERYWRLAFVIGLVAGAALFHWFFPANTPARQGFPLGLIVIGGFLVGFGTRLGNGCTSGHGVCGIARWSLRSVVATVVFISSGMLSVAVVKHGLGLMP